MSDLVQETVTDLQPCIAELLRTGHCPKPLILRVDKILSEKGKDSSAVSSNDEQDQWKCWYRLLLSDGILSIQAVVNRHFHHLLATGITKEGSLITLNHYSVQKTNRSNGSGKVAYICIENYKNGHDTICEKEDLLHTNQPMPEHMPRTGVKRKGSDYDTSLARPSSKKQTPKRQQIGSSSIHEPGHDSDSDSFETAVPTSPTKRRTGLREITGGLHLHWTTKNRLVVGNGEENKAQKNSVGQLASPSLPAPADDAKELHRRPEQALRLHTLASLLDAEKALPKKNYLCRVFAIITWVSSAILKRPGLPEKRHIKIHDLTVGRRYSGISISVFVDARHFKPAVGTIALFTGLTAQKWDGEVILNAYEKDCAGKDWFITDQKRIEDEGLVVDELREWWEQRNKKI